MPPARPKNGEAASKPSRSRTNQAPPPPETVIASIETTDLSTPPNWEFWEMDGFRFAHPETNKLQVKLREVWSALSRAVYTTIPSVVSPYKESIEQIKLRVANNLAVVVQAHIHFRKVYGTPSFLPEVAKAVALKADQDVIQTVMTVFIKARKAHIKHRASFGFEPSYSTLTDMVDQWVRFETGFLSKTIPKEYSAMLEKCIHTWKDHVDRGAMMNLAQRPRREGTAPTIPVVIHDDSDDDPEPSLPTRKRHRKDTVTASHPKRRAYGSSSVFSDNSRFTDEDYAPSETNSTTSPATPSMDSAIGLLPSSPPLRRSFRAHVAEAGMTLFPNFQDSFSERLESVNKTLSKYGTALTEHDDRIKELETLGPEKKSRKKTATEDKEIQRIAAQLQILEDKQNRKEYYVKKTAQEEWKMCKAGFDPLIKVANDRVNTLGENLAVLKSLTASDLSLLTSRVSKLESRVDNNNNNNNSSNNTARSTRSATNSRSVINLADEGESQARRANDEVISSMTSQIKDIDKRVKFLEKQPSSKDLGSRLAIAETELTTLKENDKAKDEAIQVLRKEIDELKRNAKESRFGDRDLLAKGDELRQVKVQKETRPWEQEQ
ncbi:hypothetical protein QBC42DRAFT_286365 [Cladorrhinum samala]|uniref:Uncharacterized protein n=1 Tax=Cladorrhinum samala TaxID=585594 RepID=A0AAV9HS89_9PEZI|nr:hypothetical protein QBC42DRAFT_286365 [Cladorrhinum samala]